MTTLGRLPVPAAALVAAGCVSNQQFLNGKEATAVQAALGRARFEMACPEATTASPVTLSLVRWGMSGSNWPNSRHVQAGGFPSIDDLSARDERVSPMKRTPARSSCESAGLIAL